MDMDPRNPPTSATDQENERRERENGHGDPREGTSQEAEGIRRENNGERLEFLPGYHFAPRDDELILYYLNSKINNKPILYHAFNDVAFYDHSPQELSEIYELPGHERLFFFTPRSRKYPNGSRPNRSTGNGYWKATGSEKKIYHGNEKVGVKRTLVYYEGKPGNKTNSVKTDWTMQEYISNLSTSSLHKSKPKLMPVDSTMKLDDWVLCCIQKKRGVVNRPNYQATISNAQSSIPTEQAVNTTQSYYQTTIDPIGGSVDALTDALADAIATQPLTMVPNEQMAVSYAQSGVPTEQALNTTQSYYQTPIDPNGGSSDAIVPSQLSAVHGGSSYAIMPQPLTVVPSEQMTISHAQSSMPIEQAANTTQGYRITIDLESGFIKAQLLAASSSDISSNGGSSDAIVPPQLEAVHGGSGYAIVPQPLTVIPSEQMIISHAQSGMPTEQAANTTQGYQITVDSESDFIKAQLLAASSSDIGSNGGSSDAIVAQPLAEQMTDFNGMVQPLAMAYGGPMANFDDRVQTLARAPSELMIDFPPNADCNRMAPTLVRARSETINDSNGMEQPFLAAPSELITDRMAAPSELDHMAQTSAMVPRELMTNFNGMIQPFLGASSELMTSVNGTMQNFAMQSNVSEINNNDMPLPPDAVSGQQIVDFNAMWQPAPSVPIAELNGTTSIYNNYSTGQDFQQHSSNGMDQYGMGCGDLEQPPLMHDYQQEMGMEPPPSMPNHPERNLNDVESNE